MTWYTLFKSVHVLAAVVWVGGAFVTQFFAFRVLRSPDRARQADFAADVEWIGTRIFMPASVVVFLAAIGLMVNGGWSWGELWVVYALIVYAMSFAVGAGFLGPESGRIAKVIREEGPASPNATARIRRILAYSRVELILLLGVIWAMVVKPTGDSVGWFVAALAVMAVAIALVVRAFLAGPRAKASPALE
jgi:uncharacterized membrane protein